ncbi:MAG: NYN domain-containing protein [Thermomonas sp.]
MDERKRIALLIDADNASVATLDHVLSEIADLGMANVRRAYGDWGSPQLRSWRDALLANAILPIQQVAYTLKGNASDMAMVIDAMDLLHSSRFDAFALMSSDSDFTPLAMRLRAANAQVYGFGKSQTPSAFKAACSVFFHVDAREEPTPAAEQKAIPDPPSALPTVSVQAPAKVSMPAAPSSAATQPTIKLMPPPSKKTGGELKGDTSLMNLLRNAAESTKGEDGWSNMGGLGNHIINRGPFTPKNYGYGTLKALIVATGIFEVRKDGNHVRLKSVKKATTKKTAVIAEPTPQ